MKIRNKPIILVLTLLALLSYASQVKAVSSNNPFHATLTAVEQMIADALTPLNSLLDNHEQRISELENNVQELESRVEQLETTPTPTNTPKPIATPTPDLRLFDVSISREGDIFTIVANKVIVDCRYTTSISNGGITNSVHSGNIANGTNVCEFSLTSTGASYTITVKDETGDTKSFSGTV